MNKTVRKITISALLIALTVICLKVIAINPGYSFVRISFGPALIIFASLYLGPIYGAIVGASSDVIGAFVFSTGVYQPLFTVIYGILGVLPWLLNFLFKHIKSRKFTAISFNFLLICWTIVSICLVWLYPQIDQQNLKIIYTSVGSVLAVGLMAGLYFISKHFRKKFPEYDDKFYRYALICLITEIVLMVFGNSFVKYIQYEQPYMLVVEWMAIISFINIPINVFGSYYLDILVSKIEKN